MYPHSAFAECRLSFRGLATNLYATIDAEHIHRNSLTKTINFTVENSGSSDCYYFVTIDEGMSGDINYDRQAQVTHVLPTTLQAPSGEGIAYQLYSQSVIASNIVKTLEDAVFNQNVLGPRQIQAGKTLSESFLLHVPTQTVPNLIAESYADDVILTLYQNSDAAIDFVQDCPTCIEEEQQPLNIQFGMTDYVTLSLGNPYNQNTRQALLDFGELEPHKQQSFEVYVGGRSGSGGTCSVTISSEYGSRLVREDVTGQPKSHDEVAYGIHAQVDMGNPIVPTKIDISIPNQPVSLATSSVPFLCGNNNQGVMAIDVYITIGDIDRKISGIYRDTITVEAKIGL